MDSLTVKLMCLHPPLHGKPRAFARKNSEFYLAPGHFINCVIFLYIQHTLSV